jgi:hypothetical protein
VMSLAHTWLVRSMLSRSSRYGYTEPPRAGGLRGCLTACKRITKCQRT